MGKSIFSRESLRGVLQMGNQSLLEIVLPSVCRLCNQPVTGRKDFCRPCETALTLSQLKMTSACGRCGVPRPQVLGATSEFTANCVHCRQKDFEFDGVVALWSYQDKVCEAIVAAKYGYHAALGDAMGKRLAVRVEQVLLGDLPDVVTIIPSHLTRQFRRGGNGNQAIAGAVARVIGRPLKGLLRTTRRMNKQAWLDDIEREANVRDAFSLKKSYALTRSPEFANQHILVVDDVLTTGATANEVARVLRKAGARRVSLAIVARAIRS